MLRDVLILAILLVCVVLPPLRPRSIAQPPLSMMFQRIDPCPATGCPGYVKDHVIPLACGGPDAPSNMQWQTIRNARAKDKWETKGCARWACRLPR
jgi:hypothetical protein